MKSTKRQNDMALKYELPSSVGAQYAMGEEWKNSFRRNEEAEPRGKHTVVDVLVIKVKSDATKSKLDGSWNVRSPNQGKLERVKQEMARVSTDILGISKLKWTRMGKFNSDDHYIYYCGQEYHRRNGVAITVNKRV